MNDAFYLKHDYGARNSNKMLELRAIYDWKGYAIYFALVEMMYESSKGELSLQNINGIALGLNENKEFISEFIDKCIELNMFENEEGRFYAKRVKEEKEKRKLLSEAGRKGGKNRAKQSLPQATLKPPLSQAKATLKPGEERRGEERKGEDIKTSKKIACAVPTFFNYFSCFPKEYQIDEYAGNAEWQKIYSDEDKIKAVASMESYKEFCKATSRPFSSPKNYLREKRYLNNWDEQLKNYNKQKTHTPYIETEAREPIKIITPERR